MKPQNIQYFPAGLCYISPTCSRCTVNIWCMVGCRQALTMEFLPSRNFTTAVGKHFCLKSLLLCHRTHTATVQPPMPPNTLSLGFVTLTPFCATAVINSSIQQRLSVSAWGVIQTMKKIIQKVLLLGSVETGLLYMLKQLKYLTQITLSHEHNDLSKSPKWTRKALKIRWESSSYRPEHRF